MKKLLSLALALLLLGCAAFAEETVDYTGFWGLSGVEMLGVTVDPTQLGLDMSMVVYQDGLCDLYTMDEAETGAWVLIEGGIAVTDADGVTMNMLLNDAGALTTEQSGMTLVFTREEASLPMTGLTLADFEGEWVFSYLEYMGQYVEAAELGVEMQLTIAAGEGSFVITDAEGTQRIDGVCEVVEEPDFGSVAYFLFKDPQTGAQTEDGVMLMKFWEDEIVWYTWDDDGYDLFYCFVPVE